MKLSFGGNYMRKIRNTFAILCSASFLMSLGLMGCNQKKGDEIPKGYYEVIFDTHGGSEVEHQIIKSGEKATKPSDPTYDGYTFNGWYEEVEAITEFDFETPITSTTTIYAGWKLNRDSVYPGGGGGGGDEPSQSVKYTCTNLPDWITNDGCVIFVWGWPQGEDGKWYSASFTSTTSLEFTADKELQGFLLARCVAGTTQPDWNIKTGDNPGRIYNQTNDISCSSGTYSYQCSDWKDYPNS